MADTVEIDFRGRTRVGELAGHAGRAQVPYYRCVMPSTGGVHLVTADGRGLTEAKFRTFEPATQDGRKTFLDLVGKKRGAAAQSLEISRGNLAQARPIVAMLEVLGPDWSAVDLDQWDPCRGGPCVARVREQEEFGGSRTYVQWDEGTVEDDHASYHMKEVARVRHAAETLPGEIAKLEKKVAGYDTVTRKWKE